MDKWAKKRGPPRAATLRGNGMVSLESASEWPHSGQSIPRIYAVAENFGVALDAALVAFAAAATGLTARTLAFAFGSCAAW